MVIDFALQCLISRGDFGGAAPRGLGQIHRYGKQG
jgi:hypothetical protein